jgi:hypothetical protein
VRERKGDDRLRCGGAVPCVRRSYVEEDETAAGGRQQELLEWWPNLIEAVRLTGASASRGGVKHR